MEFILFYLFHCRTNEDSMTRRVSVDKTVVPITHAAVLYSAVDHFC